MIKVLYVTGCSHSAGAEITHPTSSRTANDLNLSFGGVLACKWRVIHKNDAILGDCNENIVSNAIHGILKLLETYRSDEIFVIIGWTAASRSSYIYEGVRYKFCGPDDEKETWPGAVSMAYKSWVLADFNDALNKFSVSYLTTVNFLEYHGIDYCMFNSVHPVAYPDKNFRHELYNNEPTLKIFDHIKQNSRYLQPYDREMTYWHYLGDIKNFDDRLEGRCYHYKEDAHSCWADILEKFILSNTGTISSIPFAFQNWNYNYGWWHPNNTPVNFIYDGEKKLPISHDFMWFSRDNCGLTREEDLSNFNNPPIKWDFLFKYKNIQYEQLEDLDNMRYIFPIMLRTWNYFLKNKDYGLTFISDKVFDDVKKGFAKIVLINPLEGCYCEPDWDILDSWCNDKNLTKDQIYLIHGNLSLPTKNYNFTYIPISVFELHLTPTDNALPYVPTNTQNLFLCYNRAFRKHRIVLVCELIKAQIFNRGIISCHSNGPNQTESNLKSFGREDLCDAGVKLDDMFPLELEYPLATTNPVSVLTLSHHTLTFLSLVTETLTEFEIQILHPTHDGNNPPIFFSEKIWKPIAAGQPFIVVASHGFLKELRNRGYKTFDGWINEDYDLEPDLDKRIKMIVEELENLSILSITELQTMRENMLPILNHNLALFKTTRDNYCNNGDEPVYQEIVKIWKSF